MKLKYDGNRVEINFASLREIMKGETMEIKEKYPPRRAAP
jgi:hypothetical protein